MLLAARQLVDGGLVDENRQMFFHDVITEYNRFLSSVIQGFFVDEISKRKIVQQGTINSTLTANESRRHAEVALPILDLILSFVTLKESLGMERATLTGLMASGGNEKLRDSGESNKTEGLNHIVNDLVMVVENQHQILATLRKQSGLDVFGGIGGSMDSSDLKDPLEENYCAMLRLVGDSIRPSDAMRTLQNHITKDFDIDRFQHAMPMDEFWANITLYMDRLHSMELYLLEELENCQGNFDGLDLSSFQEKWEQGAVGPANRVKEESPKDALMFLSNHEESHTQLQNQNGPFFPPKSKDDSDVEEWKINLYDVEFYKRSECAVVA